jgi:hypothetical protein
MAGVLDLVLGHLIFGTDILIGVVDIIIGDLHITDHLITVVVAVTHAHRILFITAEEELVIITDQRQDPQHVHLWVRIGQQRVRQQV